MNGAKLPTKSTDFKHIAIIVNGHNIKLNFPIKTSDNILADVKRVILIEALKV